MCIESLRTQCHFSSLEFIAINQSWPYLSLKEGSMLLLCMCLLVCKASVPSFVDTGIPATASPALNKSALCLISWPVAIFTQTASSSVPPFDMQAHHGMVK